MRMCRHGAGRGQGGTVFLAIGETDYRLDSPAHLVAPFEAAEGTRTQEGWATANGGSPT